MPCSARPVLHEVAHIYDLDMTGINHLNYKQSQNVRAEVLMYILRFYIKRLEKFQNLAINITLECGPMPNVMTALSNIVGALCSTPQSFADAHY